MEADEPARGAPTMAGPSIIGAEDEDFENELDTNPEEQKSHFQNLDLVKRRPAHLMALVLHVVLQFDPGYLLCCLHADILASLGSKEFKKAFLDFYHTFLEKSSVLRVPVPSSVSFELDRTRPDMLTEEQQRHILQDVVQNLQPMVNSQLQDFCSKRLMGMTPGERELIQLETKEGRDPSKLEALERSYAESLLTQLEEIHSNNSDDEKNTAIFSAVNLYMRHLGVRTKTSDKKPRGNFFRKKISGNRKSDDPPKTKKGLSSILDPARWNRTDNPGPEPRHSKLDTEGHGHVGLGTRAAQSSPSPVSWLFPHTQVRSPETLRGRLAMGPLPGTEGRGRPARTPPGVTVHPPPSDGADREPGTDVPVDTADSLLRGLSSSEPSRIAEITAATTDDDEGADTERRWKSPVLPSVPVLGRGPKLPGRLGRSESLRVNDLRRPSRGSQGTKGRGGGRSRSDVDMDPSSATAALGPAQRPTPEPGEEGEPGRGALEVEPEEPPGWRELVPLEVLAKMRKDQVKRQEVISELLVTEAAHVRMLRVLHDLFFQPMAAGNFFLPEELQNIFPSLDELIELHSQFLEKLMKLRQESGHLIEEVGDVLLATFDHPEGAWFQKISSRFCSRQSFALEQLKAKQRKEPRFCAFVQEAESKPRCRRLQLKDMIPTEMQRLTKYPLLLQSIGHNTEETQERGKVERAAECCRDILQHVNQAVRDMEDLLRLKEYQRRLDLSHLRQSSDPMLSEFKNLDITHKKLVHEGPLTWRVTRDKAVEVHVLLLDDLLLLLQRQDERLLLKSHSRTLTPTPDGKTMLRPVLRLTSAMTREVATDHKAFYVLFNWGKEAQIYELVAQTVSERKNWCALITETAGSLAPADHSRPKTRPMPNSSREPLLSSSENGSSHREAPQPDVLPEQLVSLLLPYAQPGPEGQLAAAAQREVQSLKQLLLPLAPGEENGSGPPPEGDGGPPPNLTPAQAQELQERLLNLEGTVRKLEEVEEQFCNLRHILCSQLSGTTSPQPPSCS
ncbi:LOW QUALITY PROTEIN: rho guanine nucleotide exchange factor 1 [Tachyglossus aculeatus]|uniref:LOW QUALITY PROTEIN: rho guanine nucleotide exchange factor 1 n=1 Tax=Tachyglossus aculeatus TaxID=9261 RepID=UPI0018F2D0E4|nr:LOW QUALITY PROTEIN: rho guanine nucleotide exchange factor 1 [Tachyglossus aculeatus]